MIEEIDDSGFYREDFSTESDWEDFIAQLGEIFQTWELSSTEWGRPLVGHELYCCKWKIQSDKLQLFDKDIFATYHVAQLAEDEVTVAPLRKSDTTSEVHLDLMSPQNTFGSPIVTSRDPDLHTLACVYGLRRFVVIAPRKSEFLTKPSEFCFFRSAINIVAVEVQSTVPIFVQLYDPKWNYYLGVHVVPSLRINFDLVALESAPVMCRYLSGLLPLFKEKHPVSYKRPTMISVRNTYSMEPIKVRIPLWLPFSKLQELDEETQHLSRIQLTALPFGYFPDSFTESYFVCTWPEIAENIAMDSELHTDFIPSKAPLITLHQSVHANAYLSCCLSDFLKLNNATDSLESYVGRNFSGTTLSDDGSSPLEQLTESRMTPKLRQNRINAYERYTDKNVLKKLPGPMNDNELSEMLQYLLPEARLGLEPLYPYAKQQRLDEFDPLRIKSSSPDSLVSRLSCLLATCNAHFGGKSGVAQLWATFTRELRYHFDNCIKIPGVASGFPDTRTCLLHQKLQMLNICMERRILRESAGSKPRGIARQIVGDVRFSQSNKDDDNDDDDDGDDDGEEEEEFYDCTSFEQIEKKKNQIEEELKEKDKQEENKQQSNEKEKEEKDEVMVMKPLDGGGDEEKRESASKVFLQPEGRQKRLGDLKLLNSDEPLYIPVTQEPVPKTEDQLLNDAEVMLKLGPGSGLTTIMMCSSLLSDMEAFKAANPEAIMEDFIRWYSPKDWDETTDDQGKSIGQLSARMLAPGNTWQTVWNLAKAVPASRQKRLFDDTNEGLKVLHYLETRSIGEIYELTVIPVLHSAVLKLKDIFSYFSVDDLFATHVDAILSDICHLSRHIDIVGYNEIESNSAELNLAPILEKIASLEEQFYHFKCFVKMFDVGDIYKTKKNFIHQLFRKMIQNDGCPTVIGRNSGHEERVGEEKDQNYRPSNWWDVTGEGDDIVCTMNLDNEVLQNRLISKEYVMRVDGETVSVSKGQAGPQFLRAIVTGEKLRLCGAFSENTTFV